MQRKLIGILSLLFALFLFAVPASAFTLAQCAPAVSPPGQTNEFVLIAEDNIIFEPQQPNSGRVINGNVLVTSLTSNNNFSNTGIGFVRVGANTTIVGSVIAHTILLPDGGASISHCIADRIVANTPAARASCPEAANVPVQDLDFTAYINSHPAICTGSLTSGLCGTNPVVNNCVNGQPKLTVGIVFPSPAQAAAGLTDPLAPGCYGALVLEPGAVLNLAPGTFTFASVEMRAGSKLNGGPSVVNVNGTVLTNAGVFISNIDLNVAAISSGEIVKIFNNSQLDSVVINAPFGKCHLHTGTALVNCSEACCNVVDVQPITSVCEDRPEVCVCPQGFKFQLDPQIPVFNQSPADNRARNCVECQTGDNPLTGFPTCACNPTCP